jgi:hypothetical protein
MPSLNLLARLATAVTRVAAILSRPPQPVWCPLHPSERLTDLGDGRLACAGDGRDPPHVWGPHEPRGTLPPKPPHEGTI